MQESLYSDSPIALVGLGYVGLPLAVEFGKRRPVEGACALILGHVFKENRPDPENIRVTDLIAGLWGCGMHIGVAQRLTGYRPQTPFKNGVVAFVQWYRDQYIGQ